MLTDVPEINQKEMMDVFRYTIDSGSNALILGPSGGGKTIMLMDVVKEKKCFGIYINMSVLERTDFQGMPVISDDKTSVTYATPEFLPFADVRVKNKRHALGLLQNWICKQSNDSFDKEKALDLINKEFVRISLEDEIKELKNTVNYLSDSRFEELNNKIMALESEIHSDTPIVFMFDEVDKAIPEVLQTLLEFLQFRKINGRKLNITACILTANLPDEHAHTQQISHAITKRGMTFKLNLSFDLWKEWAIKNNISPLVTGFLTQHPQWFYQTAIDDTAYALPSPRTWENANNVIKHFDATNNTNYSLRDKLVAGNVGQQAAMHFSNWYKHYHELDPVISNLIDNGVFPTVTRTNLSTQEIFVCALSACSKLENALKPNNEDIITKYVKNIFNWLRELPPDVQVGSIRMVFGNNFDDSKGLSGLIKKYKLAEIKEFTEVFIDLDKNFKKWEQLNAAKSEES